jgi:hypothetical protein
MRRRPRGDGNRRPLTALNLPSKISFRRFVFPREEPNASAAADENWRESFAEETSIKGGTSNGQEVEAGLPRSSGGERVKSGADTLNFNAALHRHLPTSAYACYASGERLSGSND